MIKSHNWQERSQSSLVSPRCKVEARNLKESQEGQEKATELRIERSLYRADLLLRLSESPCSTSLSTPFREGTSASRMEECSLDNVLISAPGKASQRQPSSEIRDTNRKDSTTPQANLKVLKMPSQEKHTTSSKVF